MQFGVVSRAQETVRCLVHTLGPGFNPSTTKSNNKTTHVLKKMSKKKSEVEVYIAKHSKIRPKVLQGTYSLHQTNYLQETEDINRTEKNKYSSH